MDNEPQISAEELAAEQAAAQAPKEEDIRAKIIEDMGFDPEADKERIEKLVKKEVESGKKLSTAIAQKIKHRTDAATLRKGGTVVAPTEIDTSTLSTSEILALGRAELPDEDVEEVIDFAKLKKIKVTDALKDPMMAGYLADKAEKRRSAEAANTGSPRGASAETGEALLKKAEATGEVPTDTEGLQSLFMARQRRKLGKKN